MKVVDNSSKPKEPVKKRRRRTRRIRPSFIVFLFVLIVAVLSSLSLTVWFNIKNIYVEGEIIYSAEDVITASGVLKGENLMLLNEKQVAEKITSKLPYIKSVEVDKLYPDSVRIKAVADKEAMCLKTEEAYLIVDEDFKVLRTATDIQPDLLLVQGVQFKNAEVGSNVEVSNYEHRDILDTIFGISESHQLQITEINIENITDIRFIIENRIVVLLGSKTEADKKIKLAATMLNPETSNSIASDATGVINLKYWSAENPEAIFKRSDISEYSSIAKQEEQ